MLSDKQKQYISDPESFLLKNEVDDQINKLLYRFQQTLSGLIDQNAYNFPDKIGKTTFKVSKGNNHKGFPFQVIDFPASLGQEHAFSFRSVIWYANFFSFSLILKGTPKETYTQQLVQLVDKDFILLWFDNIWESDIATEHSMEITKNQLSELTKIYQEKEAIKIIKSYNLNQIEEFERLGTECFKELFRKV